MKPELQDIIGHIVQDDDTHARWLNTLSMMENTGACKISASEHKTGVTLMVLKHAAEEARHAFYLKKQIGKIADLHHFKDYSPATLISPVTSLQYLHRLDVELCRYLKNDLHKSGRELVFGAYLLVTYAIEVRAGDLYPVYQKVLDNIRSKVNVKSIIAEEETHLEEMLAQMRIFFGERWPEAAKYAELVEKKYFEKWLEAISA